MKGLDMEHNVPEAYEAHPIDIAEDLAIANNWPCRRGGDEIISMQVAGAYCQYTIVVSTQRYNHCVEVICSFELKVPKRKHGQVALAMNEINQGIFGKVTFTPEHEYVSFRGEQFLDDDNEMPSEQLDSLIRRTHENAEQFHHAILLVVSGETISDAFQMSTKGRYGTC